MAVISKTVTQAGNSNNNNKTSNTVGDIGLSGADFVTSLALITASNERARQIASSEFSANLQAQQMGFQSLLDASTQNLAQFVNANSAGVATIAANINPNDTRQYLPFAVIGVALFFGVLMLGRKK